MLLPATIAHSPIRYEYANRRLVYIRETSSCWTITGHISLSIYCGNSYSPPPPDLYPPLPPQPKRNRVHVITITLLAVLVVLLGSLEVVQLTTHTLFPTFPNGPAGSNQAGIAPAQHAKVTSQDNICEDTDSWHNQREYDVDLQRLR